MAGRGYTHSSTTTFLFEIRVATRAAAPVYPGEPRETADVPPLSDGPRRLPSPPVAVVSCEAAGSPDTLWEFQALLPDGSSRPAPRVQVCDSLMGPGSARTRHVEGARAASKGRFL
jgi:hypothetical protein